MSGRRGPTIFGRTEELGTITDLIGSAIADGKGGTLVVRGDAGVGKSTLLAAATLSAQRLGMATLAMTGVQSEEHLAFAGLHQLTRSLFHRFDRLPARQRDALRGAFGLSDAAAPELFLIALASLELLAEVATERPIVVVADDAQWLDSASSEVLAFMGRRVTDEPIVVLVALRLGWPSVFDAAGLLELQLGPVPVDAATAILDAHAPDLSSGERDRVVEMAAGNPLALVELPRALRRRDTASAGSAQPLPLTARLEVAFADRATMLPASTRATLLVAAANDGGDVGVVLRAASSYHGAAVGTESLDPAVDASLIDVDGPILSFHHPLVRSAIYGSSTATERRAAHAALAVALSGEPDRQVWHRAASTVDEDPVLANDLEAASERAQRQGDAAVALSALERSARFSEPGRRRQRLLHAGELAFQLAGPELAAAFLREAEPLALSPQEQARLFLLRELVEDEGLWSGEERITGYLDVVDRVRSDGDPDLALNLLLAVAQRCWWLDLPQATRDHLVGAVETMPAAPDDGRVIAALAFADPFEQGAEVARRVAAVDPASAADPASARLLGAAATAVGAFDVSLPLLAASVDGLRADGRLGLLAQALVSQAWAGLFLGDWIVATLAAEEAGRLARETGQPRWAAAGDLVVASLASLRGDIERAEEVADEAERLLLPMVAHPTLALAQFARGLLELGKGDYAAAYRQLNRIFDRADVAYHPFVRVWAIGDLAEAAARSGRPDDARSALDAVVAATQRSPSALASVSVPYARAVLAGNDADATESFAAALGADLRLWPLHRARLLLAHGSWLRRRQRIGEARVALREARALFDELGAIPWGERTRMELRATGETSRRRAPEAREQLTPQELQIAQMAADGLTNREIGEKLYLSHRTVGSHLYRIFPKLGITSRAQLATRLPARESVT